MDWTKSRKRKTSVEREQRQRVRETEQEVDPRKPIEDVDEDPEVSGVYSAEGPREMKEFSAGPCMGWRPASGSTTQSNAPEIGPPGPFQGAT